MAIQVSIPAVMRPKTDGKSTVECDGDTVAELLADLISKHPEIKNVIFDGDQLHKYVNIYVDSDDIRYVGGLQASTGDAKEVTILPAVAGGAE